MLQLGTKAGTLESLRESVVKATICPSVVFTTKKWRGNASRYTERIKRNFDGEKVIVRSSALSEDTGASSMAGAYVSIKNVDSSSHGRISEAVESVIQSYGQENDNKDEILGDTIQFQTAQTFILPHSMFKMDDNISIFKLFRGDELGL